MKKKILLISAVFYPDEVSTAGLFTGLFSILSGKGYDVEVWCGQPSYNTFKRQPKIVIYNGMNIRYLPSTNFPKTSIPGRLLNILTFLTSVFFKLIFNPERTPVFTHTNPPFIGIVLSYLCKVKHRKFVFVLQDIYPEGLVRLGKVSDGNVIIKAWQKLFISSLKRSDKIIVIGRDMEKWICEVCSECRSKTEFIPNWQDENVIFPQVFQNNPFVIELNIGEKFVVQYSGNMGLWNEMEAIGKVVRKKKGDILYMFIGDGIRKSELSSLLSGDENVIFLPFQPKEKLRNSLTACHAALVTMKEGLEGMAVPSKIYGILAAGIPVLALVPENSEIALIVKEEACGFVLNPKDAEGLYTAINTLKENRQLWENMSHNCRRAFKKKYTTEVASESYARIIDKIYSSATASHRIN